MNEMLTHFSDKLYSDTSPTFERYKSKWFTTWLDETILGPSTSLEYQKLIHKNEVGLDIHGDNKDNDVRWKPAAEANSRTCVLSEEVHI
jgi:hypothetical protein